MTQDDDLDLDPELAAKLAAAEAALAEMADDIGVMIGDDVALAQGALEAARSDPSSAADQLKDVYTGFHNIKGIGGSFGYDLMTTVANNLCQYLKAAEPGEATFAAVENHLSAINEILENDLTGDGGAAGEAICGRLGIG